MGSELLWWSYNFNFNENILKFHSSKVNMHDEESYESGGVNVDSIVEINFGTKMKITLPVKIEELIPEGIETPYF